MCATRSETYPMPSLGVREVRGPRCEFGMVSVSIPTQPESIRYSGSNHLFKGMNPSDSPWMSLISCFGNEIDVPYVLFMRIEDLVQLLGALIHHVSTKNRGTSYSQYCTVLVPFAEAYCRSFQ